MTRRRLEHGYLILLGVIVLVAITGFIWPNYSRSTQIASQIEALESKIGRLDDARIRLETQTQAIRELDAIRVARCREVPQDAQVAELVRALSLEVDGVHVTDQTFTVSGRRENVDGEDRFEGLSMVVDLEADFEHICSVIDRCATHADLVRVTGLDIGKARGELTPDRLQASISIDAIYQSGEGGSP
ncbi:MAG: hypothetical protein VX527_04625 [Planctomycetota bacterium]|nr:hypothetical protein [Planctomycetota bacterium]